MIKDQFELEQRSAEAAAKARRNSCRNLEIRNIAEGFEKMKTEGLVPIYQGRDLEIVSAGPAPAQPPFRDW